MNTVEKTMIERASIREYDPNKSIPTKDMETILQAIHQSPTYINGQQYSVLVLEKKEEKQKIMEITQSVHGGIQQHIADCSVFLLFIMDFNKIEHIAKKEGTTVEISHYMESLLIGSVDVGIGIEAGTVMAESLGYGTVMIGSVRKNTKAIIEEYNLPKYTFPLMGLCIGHSLEKLAPRPRLAMETFIHYGSYTLKDFDSAITAQNKAMFKYHNEEEIPEDSWSHFVAHFYNKGYNTDLHAVYTSQGFDIK